MDTQSRTAVSDLQQLQVLPECRVGYPTAAVWILNRDCSCKPWLTCPSAAFVKPSTASSSTISLAVAGRVTVLQLLRCYAASTELHRLSTLPSSIQTLLHPSSCIDLLLPPRSSEFQHLLSPLVYFIRLSSLCIGRHKRVPLQWSQTATTSRSQVLPQHRVRAGRKR